MKKKIELSLFITEIRPKNHEILGDFRFFPHKKYNWQPLKNSPEGFLFEGFFGDTRDQMEHIVE